MSQGTSEVDSNQRRDERDSCLARKGGKATTASRTFRRTSSCTGAIVLATGGDMSNSAHGNFYVGIMVTGATDDATDDAVQVDIVAVVYKNIE